MANSNQSAKKRMNKSEQNEEFQRLSLAVKLSNVSDMFVLQRKSYQNNNYNKKPSTTPQENPDELN